MTDRNSGNTHVRPMKFHKYLTRFALWVGALLNFYQAGLLISGNHYESEYQRNLVYQAYDGMKTVDEVGALVYVFVAIFGIHTAVRLIKRRKNAPKMLGFLYFTAAAGPMIYILMVSSRTGLPVAELIDHTFCVSVAGNALWLIISRIYYNKRIHMLV